MPGVEVLTTVKAGAGDPIRAIGSQYFVAGLTTKGRTDKARAVDSFKAFLDEFGPRAAFGNLYDDVELYFAEGGTRAHIARVVGPSATAGILNLLDRAGSPIATVRLTAKSAGAWSSDVSVIVTDGTVTNTVTVDLAYRRGTPYELSELYRNVGPTPQAIADAINARSVLVDALNLANATAAPANRPAAVSASLAAGTDDTAGVIPSVVTNALALFTSDLGPGAVATPGYDADLVGDATLAHARAMNRIAILAGSAGDTTTTIKASAAAILGDVGSEGAVLVWPWVVAPNGSGGTRTIPPHGYVAAVRARAHQATGPWVWPAGAAAEARFLVGVEVATDKATSDDLNRNNVSAIRVIGGKVKLYGWRSLSSDEASYYSVAGRDLLNVVAYEASEELEDVVFRPIDAKRVTEAITAGKLLGIAARYAEAGGIYPLGDDKGYQVSVTATPASRRIDAVLSLRIAEAAELVRVTITKVATDASL
jgi:hypothetical protein